MIARFQKNLPLTLSLLVIIVLSIALALQIFSNGDLRDGMVQPINQTILVDGTRILITTFPTATPNRHVPVAIAAQNIPRGTTITPNLINIVLYPPEIIPAGAFDNPNSVVGRIAATDIFFDEVILVRKLVEGFDSLGSVGSDFAAVLDPGRVMTTLWMPEVRIPQGMQFGDRIDLLIAIPEPEEETSFVTRAITDAQVIWMGIAPRDGRIFVPAPTATLAQDILGTPINTGNISTTAIYSPLADVNGNIPISIAVRPQDAVTLTWALEASFPITIVLRSARTRGLPDSYPMSMDSFDNLYINLPTFTPTVTATATPNATQFQLTNDANNRVLQATQTASANIIATQQAINMTMTSVVQQTSEASGSPIASETDLPVVMQTATALANLFDTSPTPTP